MTADNIEKTAAVNHVVFFDGICGLCNSFVDFLLRMDKNNTLRFAPLQGDTAKNFELNADPADLNTVIFYSEGKLFTRSDAVIEIFRSMGGVWNMAVLLKIFPKIFRDTVYNFVAKNRLKWFGQKESCRMPTEKERGRLLN